MNHLNLFKEKNVILDIKSSDKRSVLEEMIDHAIENKLLAPKKKKSTIEALLAREQLGSTGLGNGIAIPHVKVKGFADDLAILARSQNGIDFRSIDGEDVNIFFLIVSSTEDSEKHLSILQWISGLARHRDFKSFVKGATDEKEIVSILKEIGG
jgi:mannitol/fructose-specific phosphotransferase system IIA component (Ntr-type)